MSTTTPSPTPTDDAEPQSQREWVMSRVRSRVTADPDGKQNVESNVWTSTNRLKSDASSSEVIHRQEVRPVVDHLAEEGTLINWFGLLAPADREHMQAIVACENQSGCPRRILLSNITATLERGSE